MPPPSRIPRRLRPAHRRGGPRHPRGDLDGPPDPARMRPLLGRHHAPRGRASCASREPPPRLPEDADRPADDDECPRRPPPRGDGGGLARLPGRGGARRRGRYVRAGAEPHRRAIAKYWICKRVVSVVYEALECHGGNGFIEDHLMARLYREAPLNGIWEGSGNVMCLDVLRSMT